VGTSYLWKDLKDEKTRQKALLELANMDLEKLSEQTKYF